MEQEDSRTVNDDLSKRLANMTLVQKQKLKKRNLKTSGSKNELVLRLMYSMQGEHENGVVESSGRSEGEDSHSEKEDLRYT